MTVKAVLALDLDQTLIYSGGGDVCVEELDGAPLSFMTAPAHALLAARTDVLPVTTRTPEQYGRVRLPCAAQQAICSNGGVLLVDGVRSPEWDARVAGELAQVTPAAEVRARLAEEQGEPWVLKTRHVEELFAYVVAQSRDAVPLDWIESLATWADERGWALSVQGRKVYVVPTVLSKGAAAVRLAEQLGAVLLAAGDSLLDQSLLEAAEFAVRPAHGELHDLGWTCPGLQVTGASGPAAAEEVLLLLGAAARDVGRGARHAGTMAE